MYPADTGGQGGHLDTFARNFWFFQERGGQVAPPPTAGCEADQYSFDQLTDLTTLPTPVPGPRHQRTGFIAPIEPTDFMPHSIPPRYPGAAPGTGSVPGGPVPGQSGVPGAAGIAGTAAYPRGTGTPVRVVVSSPVDTVEGAEGGLDDPSSAHVRVPASGSAPTRGLAATSPDGALRVRGPPPPVPPPPVPPPPASGELSGRGMPIPPALERPDAVPSLDLSPTLDAHQSVRYRRFSASARGASKLARVQAHKMVATRARFANELTLSSRAPQRAPSASRTLAQTAFIPITLNTLQIYREGLLECPKLALKYGLESLFSSDPPHVALPAAGYPELESIVNPLPDGWEAILDPTGFLLYSHPTSGAVSMIHPHYGLAADPATIAPAALPLPKGWILLYDAITERPYFYDIVNSAVQWDPPASGLEALVREPRPADFHDNAFSVSTTDPGYDRTFPPPTVLSPLARYLLLLSYSYLVPRIPVPWSASAPLVGIVDGLLRISAGSVFFARFEGAQPAAADPAALRSVLHAWEAFANSGALITTYLSPDCYTLNPAVKSAEGLRTIEALGRLMGICLLSQIPLPLILLRPIYKMLIGSLITVHDFQLAQPRLYARVKTLREDPKRVLAQSLTYTVVLPEFGLAPIPLRPGSATAPVHMRNYPEYIRDMIYFSTYHMYQHQAAALRRGFAAVVPIQFLPGVLPSVLEYMLVGVPPIDFGQLDSLITVVPPLQPGTPALRSLHPYLRAIFWSTLTGSLIVPPSGIKDSSRYYKPIRINISPLSEYLPPIIVFSKLRIYTNPLWGAPRTGARVAIRSILTEGPRESSLSDYYHHLLEDREKRFPRTTLKLRKKQPDFELVQTVDPDFAV